MVTHESFHEWITLVYCCQNAEKENSLLISLQTYSDTEMVNIQQVLVILLYKVLNALDNALNGKNSIPYEIGVSRISSENCIEIEKSLSELFNRESNIPWPEINVFVQIISAVVQQSYLKFKYPDRTSPPYTDNYASDEIIPSPLQNIKDN